MARLASFWSSLAVLFSTQVPVFAQIPAAFSVTESSSDLGLDGIKYPSPLPGEAPIRQSAGLDSDSYIIGPGDVLSLKVFSSPEISGPLPVLADGTVTLPIVGPAKVNGLTIQQASLWIQQLLSKDLLSPELQLTVSNMRPLQISMIGQLQTPGLYFISGDNGSLPTLVTAIQQAGGITQAANITDVVIQRRVPGSANRFKQTSVNLYSLLFAGDQTQNPYLFDGDIIKIQTGSSNPEDATELGATNINPNGINVKIVGEVESPGNISMPSNTPLNKAILMAGDTVDLRANRRNIELFRLNRNGTVTLERYALDLSADVGAKNNPPLRDGDIVKVKRNLVAKGTDLINDVTQPITGLISVWGLVRLVQDQDNR